MTLQGPIGSFSRELIVERYDERLPAAWVCANRTVSIPAGLGALTQLAPTPFRTNIDTPLLVMLGESNDRAVFEEMLAHAQFGTRVYMLVPEGWGAKDVPIELLYASKVLIRRIKVVPASAILTAQGARVWLGGPWHLRLDPLQSTALRQIFLRQFWHDAFEESWTGGKQLIWRPAGERPFDVPDVSRHAPVVMAADLRLDTTLHGALVHWTGEEPPQEQPRRLWLRPGKDHHEKLARFVRNGTDGLWDERGLPAIAVNETGGQVLLAGTKAHMRITLNADQSADARKLLEAAAPWTFGVDVHIGNPALREASFWLAGEKQARALEKRQLIPLADVIAVSIRSIPETNPPNYDPLQPLALTARYSWNVIPPKAPAGAAEDPLLEAWRKVDAEWTSRLGKVREALEMAEEHQGRIAKAFSRLAGAVLGFGRTQIGLLETVTDMGKQRPSATGPSIARGMLSNLVKIEERAQKLQGDIDDAERKEREQQERDKQLAAWQQRTDEAKRELPHKREELAAAEERSSQLSAEKAAVDEAIKSTDKDDPVRKDIEAKQKKRHDEIKQRSQATTRIVGELRALELQAEETFDFRPPANLTVRPVQSTGRFVPQSSNVRSSGVVPDEALPEVGALRVFKNQRYLVIRTWEELFFGEKEAVRLNAQLVAAEKS